jgi:hypothetical protein
MADWPSAPRSHELPLPVRPGVIDVPRYPFTVIEVEPDGDGDGLSHHGIYVHDVVLVQFWGVLVCLQGRRRQEDEPALGY